MALNNLQVGPQVVSDGSQPVARAGKSGETSVSDAHARYMEPNYRGLCFSLDSDAVTAAAANATKGALATVKLVNGFANPQGGTKLAVITAITTATTSGTPGGPLFYNFLGGISVTSAATGTIRSNYLGGSSTSGMLPQVNVVVTVSGGATTALTQLGVHGGPAAIAAGAGLYGFTDYIDGKIIVGPGCVFGLTVVAAGTSHVIQSTIYWEEIPI